MDNIKLEGYKEEVFRNVVKQARILYFTVDIVHIYPIFLKIENRLEKRIMDFAL